MQERTSFDYAVVRIVPRVDREEFLNVGVLLSCHDTRRLMVRFDVDEACLAAMCPDVDMGLVHRHLAAMEKVCAGGADAGPLGELTARERFHWLTAIRSSMVQTSRPHMGRTADPGATLTDLMAQLVER